MNLFRRIHFDLSSHYRRTRFALFRNFLNRIPKPCRILDLGGTPGFWCQAGFHFSPEINVEIVNLVVFDDLPANVTSVTGDATDLNAYADREFDLVHSNSVINCVGGSGQKLKMAREIRRVGKRYWVQAPNRNFPIDWRTDLPLFHLLPAPVQAALAARLPMGRWSKFRTTQDALEYIRLYDDLNLWQFRECFPDAEILREKVFGLTKSFIAAKGLAGPQR